MATKKLKALSDTGQTLYCVVQRQADDFFLDDANGTFASSPADFYLSLAEHATIKGLYSVSESRTTWDNGDYIVMVYSQAGGSPSIAADFPLGSETIEIQTDVIVFQSGDSFARIGATGTGLTSLATAAQATAIETDTQDIQSRIPAALSSGNMKVDILAISGDTTAADNAEAFFDGTGYAGTNNVIPLVTTTTTATNLTNAATNGDLTATMKASVNTEADTALNDYGALKPTTAGRTLDVAATGEAGLDFDNIKDAIGAHTLTNITVPVVTTSVNLTTNNDKTGYALSSAAIQAIWDALTSALTTVGSIGKKLADWTIGTAQTGDSFARLGAPAGASVSADIAAVKVDTAAVKVKTDQMVFTTANRLNSQVYGMESNTLTASALATDAVSEITTAILASGDIDGYSIEQSQKLMLASLGGELSGAATATVEIRAADDSKVRISATVDGSGNRTAVVLDATG